MYDRANFVEHFFALMFSFYCRCEVKDVDLLYHAGGIQGALFRSAFPLLHGETQFLPMSLCVPVYPIPVYPYILLIIPT